MRVLIVDDEPLAQDILESYVRKVPELELVHKCGNALEAFGLLSRQKVDLMLLDINMPEINGVDFLRNIKNPPLVIFTTAYSEYALESYELDAVDYLLKPVPFDRFLKAIDKAGKRLQQDAAADTVSAPAAGKPDTNLMFVKSEGKLVKIDLGNVWFIEGLKDYIRFWTDEGKIIVHSTMKHLEEQLQSQPHFVRVQKSYIVNMAHISEVWGNSIRIKDQSITIGSTYRDEINGVLEKYKLI